MTTDRPTLSRAIWRKSSYSDTGNTQCVEVARNIPGIVGVRDSKDPEGDALVFTPAAWRRFTSSLKG